LSRRGGPRAGRISAGGFDQPGFEQIDDQRVHVDPNARRACLPAASSMQYADARRTVHPMEVAVDDAVLHQRCAMNVAQHLIGR
jgi:hypothetical protein